MLKAKKIVWFTRENEESHRGFPHLSGLENPPGSFRDTSPQTARFPPLNLRLDLGPLYLQQRTNSSNISHWQPTFSINSYGAIIIRASRGTPRGRNRRYRNGVCISSGKKDSGISGHIVKNRAMRYRPKGEVFPRHATRCSMPGPDPHQL